MAFLSEYVDSEKKFYIVYKLVLNSMLQYRCIEDFTL